MQNNQDIEIKIGSYVKLLVVDTHWFEHETLESYEILQDACRKPLKVTDIYDGKIELRLPAVKDHDGELTGNCITTIPGKVEVVVS
ncbi:hypothetical protein AB6D04_04295 [Vibrio splendidus]|uniref:hypothetical protein n=1 Tax=Vibrio splendidus TaxID=29497 RepID=UPI000C85CF26|nr:hypothetical protein [Vibrio splendidus]PMN75089.1 hypothetical protein BCT24_08605 [Vibrio splendidus]